MASQSDIDSPLCKLNTHIDPITNTCSSQFPAIHHFFLLLQLLELSWLPCHNKGIGLSFVHFGLTCPYDRDKIFWIILWVLLLCSVRPSTMTEEYRVPDGMVGLSEYMHRRFLNQTWCLCCYVSCVETKIEMSLLLSLKSSAEEVNRLTKYSRILAARSRLRMVSYVLTPDLPSQQSMIFQLLLMHIFMFIHRQCRPFRKKCFSDRLTRCRTVSWCSHLRLCISWFPMQLLHSTLKDKFISGEFSFMDQVPALLKGDKITLLNFSSESDYT